MPNRKLIYSILIFLAVLVLILASIILFTCKNNLKIIFLDVGQGDAILISQGQNQILIDGGKDGKVLLEKVGKFVPFWDRNIEVVIETHPDADHIGGLVDLFDAYSIKTVLKTNTTSDSATFEKLEEEIVAENSEKVEAKKGAKIIFSNGAQLDVLYPFVSVSDSSSSNENSVVAKLTYGENSFLLAGDLPSTQESALISGSLVLNSRVLKVAHHGSKYSTSNEFLEAVQPQVAIISVGKNSYGHPNQEIIKRFLEHKINILRTDEAGDIAYECQNINSACMVVN